MMSNYVIDVYVNFWSCHVHGLHSVYLLKLGVALLALDFGRHSLIVPIATIAQEKMKEMRRISRSFMTSRNSNLD